MQLLLQCGDALLLGGNFLSRRINGLFGSMEVVALGTGGCELLPDLTLDLFHCIHGTVGAPQRAANPRGNSTDQGQHFGNPRRCSLQLLLYDAGRHQRNKHHAYQDHAGFGGLAARVRPLLGVLPT